MLEIRKKQERKEEKLKNKNIIEIYRKHSINILFLLDKNNFFKFPEKTHK